MNSFSGEQIRPECRGDYVVVINHPAEKPTAYAIHICKPSDSDFVGLTEKETSAFPVDRVYSGVSVKTTVFLSQQEHNLKDGRIILGCLDDIVVEPNALKQAS